MTKSHCDGNHLQLEDGNVLVANLDQAQKLFGHFFTEETNGFSTHQQCLTNLDPLDSHLALLAEGGSTEQLQRFHCAGKWGFPAGSNALAQISQAESHRPPEQLRIRLPRNRTTVLP